MHRFSNVIENPNFRFYGNVQVGKVVSVNELLSSYNAVIMAHGLSNSKKLGIEGENLKQVYDASEIVGWYNGCPKRKELSPRLKGNVVIVGQGNVALDIARLFLSPVELLRATDIPQQALDILSKSEIESISIVGRRGPLQASFTTAEMREILAMKGVSFDLNRELIMEQGKKYESFISENRPLKRYFDLLSKQESTIGSKRLSFKYCLSPHSIIGRESCSSIVFRKTILDGNCNPKLEKAISTNETVEIPADLIIKSIGYTGERVCKVPFDEKSGTIPHKFGHVFDPKAKSVIPNLYTAGWAKTGSVGELASTRMDAYDTADSVVDDLNDFPFPQKRGHTELEEILKSRSCRWTTFEQWQKIDREEVRRGLNAGKSRQKFLSFDEMISIK